MKIYLDLLLLLNFIYDFLLLMTVSITLKRNTKIIRIILGSFFGSLSTLIIIIPLNNYILLFLNILSGIIMLLITFDYHNLSYFINNCLYLYMTSVILAGFLYFLKIQFNNLAYIISLLLAPLILYLYIIEQRKLKKIVNYYQKILITFKNNQTLELMGFIDSGNKLQDPITHKYIILVNKKHLKGIYNIRSPMYIPIHTVNKNSLLECISIKNIIINNKVYNNYLVGVIDNIQDDNIECLLNYHLLEE